MNYDEWQETVHSTIKADSLWKMTAYRLSLFLADISWHDVTALLKDRRISAMSDQLYRAVGSIGANLAEGYSHGTGPNRARYYEYALGSARESRDWYHKGRLVLGEAVVSHRSHRTHRQVALDHDSRSTWPGLARWRRRRLCCPHTKTH